MRLEEAVQIQIFKYLSLQYPDVVAISEPSGLRVSMGLATKLKKLRSKHRQLDIFIMEPRNGYHALLIELKAKNIYKRNGELLKNEHLEDQQRTIDLLNSKGYYATFSVGFEQTKQIIDDYLNGNC